MAWTSPMTAVANATFTAAQFNTYVRDTLNETAPAKATAANQIFVSTGSNAIAARTPTGATVGASETTTSTSYANLTTVGPAASSVTTGTKAIVFLTAQVSNSATVSTYMGCAVSGASTIAAADAQALVYDNSVAGHRMRGTATVLLSGLTAGSNTFTAQYRVDSGTGTFSVREILVVPL